MKITPYNQKNDNKTVLCLGWFDSVHEGHKCIINNAKELCKESGLNLAVLTFKNDNNFLLLKNSELVFDFEERLSILKNLGVNEVLYATFNAEFASKTPLDFLNEICNNRPIAGFVCGSDYRFGCNGTGDVALLKRFCELKDITLKVCPFEKDFNGEKISTGTIKQLLVNGEIKKANQLLGHNFFITGEVVKGRRQGSMLGFPTANVLLSETKIKFKRGVYSTTVEVDSKKFKAITNFGTAPTFEYSKDVIECHILDFNGDLYGKKITVYFNSFIREIKKFNSKEELVKQLQDDVKVIK